MGKILVLNKQHICHMRWEAHGLKAEGSKLKAKTQCSRRSAECIELHYPQITHPPASPERLAMAGEGFPQIKYLSKKAGERLIVERWLKATRRLG
jgi:hypothetical protein